MNLIINIQIIVFFNKISFYQQVILINLFQLIILLLDNESERRKLTMVFGPKKKKDRK